MLHKHTHTHTCYTNTHTHTCYTNTHTYTCYTNTHTLNYRFLFWPQQLSAWMMMVTWPKVCFARKSWRREITQLSPLPTFIPSSMR